MATHKTTHHHKPHKKNQPQKRRQLLLWLGLVVMGVGIVWSGDFIKSYLTYQLIDAQIARLSVESQQRAKEQFYVVESKPVDLVDSSASQKSFMAGVLARVRIKDRGKIWVWTNLGLKSFVLTPQAELAYYDVCQAYRDSVQKNQESNQAGQQAGMRVDSQVRQQTSALAEWKEWVETGSFVQLTVEMSPDDESTAAGELATTTDRIDTAQPQITSIAGYDQPLFLPLDLERSCVK